MIENVVYWLWRAAAAALLVALLWMVWHVTHAPVTYGWCDRETGLCS